MYTRADPGRAGGSMPPPVVSVCNIFCAWLLAFRHTTQLTSKRFVNRIAEGVGITPPLLSLTLTLAQPRCNCKCNLTLTLDSRYIGRHALAWEYQRWHLRVRRNTAPEEKLLQENHKLTIATLWLIYTLPITPCTTNSHRNSTGRSLLVSKLRPVEFLWEFVVCGVISSVVLICFYVY